MSIHHSTLILVGTDSEDGAWEGGSRVRGYMYAYSWPPDAKSQLIGKDSYDSGRLKAGGEGDDRG